MQGPQQWSIDEKFNLRHDVSGLDSRLRQNNKIYYFVAFNSIDRKAQYYDHVYETNK